MVRLDPNTLLDSTSLIARITILDGSTEAYKELHDATTNGFGMLLLDIGCGEQLGAAAFDDLDWSSIGYSIKVEVKIGTNPYFALGTNPLLAVPYARYAETVSNPLIVSNDVSNVEIGAENGPINNP